MVDKLNPLSASILISLALFLCAESLRANGSQSEIKNASTLQIKENSKPSNNASNAASVLVPSATTPDVGQPASTPNQNYTNSKKPDDSSYWPSKGAVPDWLLVIVGGITAFYAWKTLRYIAVQAKTAETAANAALKTSESIVNTERAYVFANVSDAIFPTPGQGPQVAIISILFVNYGKTPAIIRRSRGSVHLLATVPQEFGLPAEERDFWNDGLVLAPTLGEPERTITTTIHVTIAPTDMAAISGERTFYCYGVRV